MNYKDMPQISGSWSHESIGFEDRTGTKGVQISYGSVPLPETSYRIPPACHVEDATSCCNSKICQCEGVECVVDTNAHFEWMDLIGIADQEGSGVQHITDWTQNGDDGWKDVDLPFDFHWFGRTERRITIGTNGVLTFGTNQLSCGASEPVPCGWNTGGDSVTLTCVGEQRSDERSGVCTNNGDPPDGIIAPFWADLDTSANRNSEGVYYQISTNDDPHLFAFNKLTVEYNVPIWNHASDPNVQFEVILLGDGTVLMQYKDMPSETSSWSRESIGFEDRSGTRGVQISDGVVPRAESAYRIPPSCHVDGGTA
eukprot:SAG31_NODE_8549_length_1432_cov_0.758440_1_plen_311_part_10